MPGRSSPPPWPRRRRRHEAAAPRAAALRASQRRRAGIPARGRADGRARRQRGRQVHRAGGDRRRAVWLPARLAASPSCTRRGQLRIGFGLRAGDGTEAAFRRRKGDKGTLLDPAENPLPDDALAPFLGAATRELFRRSFGIDAAELRAGGEALLRSGGEAGESLLAGLGLPNLRALQDRLEGEARGLHGDRRGPRRLNIALDAYREARNALSEASIKPRDWEAAEAAQREIEARLEAVRAELRSLAAEEQKLRRIQRVAPTLARLEDARGRLGGVADAPRLPPDMAVRLAASREALREAGRDAARLADEAAALRARQAGLVDDPDVLAAQDAIDALAERRPELLRMEAEDLPPVQEEIARYRAEAAAAGGALDPDASPEALRAALPAAPVRQSLRQARDRRLRLLDARRTAAEALADADRAREALLRALAEAGAPPSPLPLRHAIDAARGEGPVERELAAATRAAVEAGAAAAAALTGLRLWQGSAAALAALPLPLPAEAEAAARAMATAASGAEAMRRALGELDAEATLREVRGEPPRRWRDGADAGRGGGGAGGARRRLARPAASAGGRGRPGRS